MERVTKPQRPARNPSFFRLIEGFRRFRRFHHTGGRGERMASPEARAMGRFRHTPGSWTITRGQHGGASPALITRRTVQSRPGAVRVGMRTATSFFDLAGG